jgi:hypothetical protein
MKRKNAWLVALMGLAILTACTHCQRQSNRQGAEETEASDSSIKTRSMFRVPFLGVVRLPCCNTWSFAKQNSNAIKKGT